MPNSLFLFDNQSDAGLVTASSVAGGSMPAANVQQQQRSQVWRSGAGTSSYLDVAMSVIYPITHLALLDLNLSTDGVIRVQSWADAIAGSVPGVDMSFSPLLYINEGAIPSDYGLGMYGLGVYGTSYPNSRDDGRNLTIVPLATPSTHSFWRITLTDASLSYQQLGRLFIGSGVTFGVNLANGWRIKRIARSARKESIGGQSYVQARPSKLQISGNFDMLTDTERTQFLLRMEEYDNSKPFIFAVTPEQSSRGLTTGLYGQFDESQITGEFIDRNKLDFVVTEAL